MNDEHAKQQLAQLLEQYTVGSVLHLLADLCQDSADAAEQNHDTLAHDQLKTVEHTLFVVGLGVDAANPTK